jgi:hypothetical protein
VVLSGGASPGTELMTSTTVMNNLENIDKPLTRSRFLLGLAV